MAGEAVEVARAPVEETSLAAEVIAEDPVRAGAGTEKQMMAAE